MAGNRDLGKIKVDLELKSAAFAKGAKEAQQSLGGLSQTFSALKNVAAGFSIGAGLTSMVKQSIEFESAFAGVRKTVEASGEFFDQLSNQIKTLSTVLPNTTTELSNIAAAAGQLGINNESIIGFTETMAQLGFATNLTSLEAADSLARFANITKMSQGDFDRLGSTIVALGNNMATTEREIVAMAQRLAGAGEQVGMSEDQIVAFAAALSSLGIEAEAGGSAFSRLFKDIALSVETGKGQLENFAKLAGMTTAEFQRAFKDDAATAIAKFLEGLGQLEGSGQSAIKVLEDMGFTEIRLSDAMLRTSGNSKVLTDALSIANEAWTENTALQTEAAQRSETLESKLIMLKNAASNFAMSLGDELIPGLKFATDALKDFLIAASFQGTVSASAKNAEELAFMFSNLGARAADLKSSLERQEKASGWWADPAEAARLRGELEKVNQQMATTVKLFGGLVAPAKESAIEIYKYSEVLGPASEKGEKEFKDIKTAIENATKATKAATDELGKLKKQYEDTVKGIEKNRLDDAFSKAIKANDWQGLDELGKKLYQEVYTNTLNGVDASIRDTKSADEYAKKIAEAVSGDEVKKGFAEIEQNLMEAQKKLGEDRIEVEKDIAKIQQEAFADQMARVGKYQSELKDIAYATGANALQGLADALKYNGDVGKALERAIGQGMEDGLAATADYFAPGSGQLVKPIVELGEYFFKNLFSGSNPGREARDAMIGYLEELLNSNIEAGDEIQAGWSETFQALAGEGQTSFLAIGSAIAEMTGQSQEYAGQLGYILATNLNGNLDEARLLVQALGLDAEEMGRILEEAALKGEMSWHEFEVMMQGVNAVTQEGRVGVGDLTGAYEQFINTSGRGQMSLAALRTFAIEAQEAGAQSVAQLQEVMQRLGFSQEETDRMIQVLQQRGVANMEDLENASNRVLGGIVADLESAGVQWGEFGEGIDKAVERMSELEERLNGISDKEIDIKVNVNYEENNKPEAVSGSALGNIFNGLEKFASGGIVSKPTMFRYGASRLGIMGEAGPEAILPLGRNARGELGVKGGGSGGVSFFYSIDARGSAPGVEAKIARAVKVGHDAAVKNSIAAIGELKRRGAL